VRRLCVPAEAIAGDTVELVGDVAGRLARVLRARSGDRIVVFTGDGSERIVEVERVSQKAITGAVIEHLPGLPEPAVRVTLCQSTVKGDRFEWALEKGTELGVARFVPLTTGRAVVRSEAGGARFERWRRIIVEATEQCGRCVVPELSAPASLDETLASAEGLVLLPYEGESALGLRTALRAAKNVREVSILIGPEGGFAEEEVARAADAGAKPVSLGRRILRSETAGIAAVAAVMYELRELGG
jgi:16S rRNA (uracil1498-N3)-methyltransferase